MSIDPALQMPISKKSLDEFNETHRDSHFSYAIHNGNSSLHYRSKPFQKGAHIKGELQEKIILSGYGGIVGAQMYTVCNHLILGEMQMVEGIPVVSSETIKVKKKSKIKESKYDGKSIIFTGPIEDLNKINENIWYKLAKGTFATEARKIFGKKYPLSEVYEGEIEKDIDNTHFDGFVDSRLIFREDNLYTKAMNKMGIPQPVCNFIGKPVKRVTNEDSDT